MDIKAFTANQFDEDSQGWTEKMYANPAEEMRRRAYFIMNWGTRLRPGDRVLELGCGDGSLCCFLAKQGLKVSGLDISPGMVDEARRRAMREGVVADFRVGDIDSLGVEEAFDAAISFMGAFFMYADEPRRVLERLLKGVSKKVILDWNHRSAYTPAEAAQLIENVGFKRVEWRPWFVPLASVRDSQLRLRCWLEERPLLSLMPMILKRWRYGIYIKGENPSEPYEPDGASKVFGNRLPGSSAQRLLIRYGLVTRGKRRRI